MGNLSKKIFSVAHYVANKVQQPAVILLYHRVTTLQQDPQDLSVTPEHFNSHLAHLATDFNLLDAERFLYHVKNKKAFPERSVFVTFDDGYADNYLEALPLLTKHQAPALFYITTSKINTAFELWWDDLERVLLTPGNLPPVLQITINGQPARYITDTLAAIRETYYALQQVLRFCKPAEIESAMQQLYDWSGKTATGRASHRLMTWEELKAMGQAALCYYRLSYPPPSGCGHAELRRTIYRDRDVQRNPGRGIGRPAGTFFLSLWRQEIPRYQTLLQCRQHQSLQGAGVTNGMRQLPRTGAQLEQSICAAPHPGTQLAAGCVPQTNATVL
ncbi:peptidoglycan/xylan/chitin deacetylase (PgdA/CDA1 family) [Chitinophaga sp. W3I9]